ncbi:SIR2 family protein [Enterococcus plantarum]|nr:SIR2 family protein [Enterococcus plantarum]
MNIPEKICECGEKIKDHESVSMLYNLKEEIKIYVDSINKHKLGVFEQDWLITKALLDSLRVCTNIVPFIGAGISVPLGLVNWSEMIGELSISCSENVKGGIQFFLGTNRYLECFDEIISDPQNQLTKDIESIKYKISEMFSFEKIDMERDNNYDDILMSDYPLIMTTNYDEVIDKVGEKYDYKTVIFKNIEDIKSLEKFPSIVHLHGSSSYQDKGSMVVNIDDYKNLYDDPKCMRRLQSLLGNKSILFMGYSLDDYYFMKQLMEICEANSGFSDYYAIMINPNIDILKQRIPEYYEKIKIISINFDDKCSDINKLIVERIRYYMRYINNSLYLRR